MTETVNLKELEQLTGNNPEALKKIISLFLSTTKSNINKLEHENNWKATCHTMKGAALGIGAVKMAELMKQAESAEFSGDEKRTYLTKIKNEFSLVEKYLISKI